jgi:hypothetical protein
MGHQPKNGPQALSVPGERVLDTRRNLSVHLAADDVIALQFSQLLRQHFLGRSRKESLKLAESPDSALQIKQDGWFPFPANDAGCDRYRTIERVHSGVAPDTRLPKGAYWQKRDFSLLSPQQKAQADFKAKLGETVRKGFH